MSNQNETAIFMGSLGISLLTLTLSFFWFIQPPQCWGTFPEVENIPSDSFNYRGIAVWEPISENVDPVIQKMHPEFELNYQKASSSTKAVEQLLNNEVPFIIVSEGEIANHQGSSLKQIPVTPKLSIVSQGDKQPAKAYGELLRTQQGQSLLEGLGLISICPNN